MKNNKTIMTALICLTFIAYIATLFLGISSLTLLNSSAQESKTENS